MRPGGIGAALGVDRTRQTARVARKANRCAEFHHGLVEIARMAGVEEFLRLQLETTADHRRADVAVVVENARQHAEHIAIHRGEW